MVCFSSGVLYTPPEGFPILCELVVVLLNMPALKHAPCCSVWVAVEHLCLIQRCMPWPSVSASSASAEAAMSSLLRAPRYSFSRCLRGLLVCPMYTFGNSVQGWSRLLCFINPMAVGSWGEPRVGEGSSEGEIPPGCPVL